MITIMFLIQMTLPFNYVIQNLPFQQPFHEMVNIHQVCSWLCTNPNILLLTYNMYLSIQTPVVNIFNFISSNFSSSTLATGVSHIPNQEDKVNLIMIYLTLLLFY